MADLRISDLVTASQLKNDDYYEISQSESGTRVSYKATLLAIAVQIATMVDFTSDLNTTSKKITGAINELKNLISLIPQFSIEVVETLPTEDISDTTIYLVPAEDPEVGNYYEEYIHVNDAWELVGTTAVDLSAYYTKLEVDGLLATKASVTEVALKENKSDMPTDVRTIIKDCKTPKNAAITNGIAQFECIEENLVKGLKVTMNPIQDLHGYDYPWVGGAGKNKLNAPDVTLAGSGYIYNDTCDIKAGTYTISFSGGSSATIVFYDSNGDALVSGSHNVPWTFTLSADAKSAKIYVSSAGTYKEIMVEQGSTKTSYAPYSNICLISGRTEASVKRTGVNFWGGETLADDIVSKVASATKNTTEKTVSYSASNIDTVVLFSKFEPNKQYTAIVTMKSGVPNMAFVYTDNTKTTIGAGVTVSTFGKTVKSIEGSWVTGNSVMYYDQSGIFEGVKTADDFEPYTAETKTHQYSETIYGGTDDFVNGGATSTYGTVDLGTLYWISENSEVLGLARVNNTQIVPLGIKWSAVPMCSSYKGVLHKGFNAFEYGEIGLSNVESAPQLRVRSEAFIGKTNEEIKAMLSGVQLCYELATPTELTLTAEEITTVSGTNIISGTEPISECKYTELATVDDLIKIIGGQ